MCKQYLTDFHMHTEYSPDSDSSMLNMCNAAVKSGMIEIAITDHVEMTGFYSDGFDKAIALSFEQAGEMQKLFEGRLKIARGIELGEPLHNLEETELLLDSYEFDFVLGALHNLKNEQDFYYYDYSDVDVPEMINKYFTELLEMVEWGRFHSLAHFTYPFRYIPKNLYPADYRIWRDKIDDVLLALAEKDIALEINTSGLRKDIGKTIPDLPIVHRFRELGGERITVGSDAHTQKHVGRNIEDGLLVAKQAGFEYVTVFHKGNPEMIKII
ncbi:MAG: histidinol-phosphatase HisJ family protein [Oscillospiraceae bacterium]|nr:histidinol-phosphatase HisJ family protein [Oscillospiraceae bacterium]MDD4413826.1 histidinol-phosphatase HisJ family protein [Oscillospiraceae bacterium]